MHIRLRALLILFISVGCQSPVSLNNPTSPTPPVDPKGLKAEAVINAFKASGIPVRSEVIYTAETDPNKLLGRPNQYTEKASWADERLKQGATGELSGGTVEVFDSAESLERRKRYVEEIGKSVPFLAQYVYAHKNVLLRLDHSLTPKQAGEYENILKVL
jgi:hypothetical protein